MEKSSDKKPELPDGIKFHSKRLKSPLAREVAELILLQSDLQRCVQGFQLFGMLTPSDEDWKSKHAAESLFRDAVISFTACFDSAVPHNLNADEIFKNIGGGTDFFRWLLDLRDTWIAHRHGTQRYADYMFVIHPETGKIEGEGPVMINYILPDRSEAKQLVRIAQIALDHVERELSDKTKELRLEIDNLYPNQRLKLPEVGYVVPDPKEIRMGRKKYANISTQKASKERND